MTFNATLPKRTRDQGLFLTREDLNYMQTSSPSAPSQATRAARWRRTACLLAGGALLVDALVLMAHGQFHLGVTLPAALGLAWVLLAWRWQPVHAWLAARAGRQRVWWLLWSLFWLWLASLLLFWLALAHFNHSQAHAVERAQAIIVLGSATRDGHPSPALAMRLDTAAALAQRLSNLPVVTSGGVDWGERESEGEIMARYLQNHHALAAERLLAEKQSTSTDLNLSLSAPLLLERGVDVHQQPVAIVTSDFHTLRADRIARRQGYAQPITVPAPMPLSTRMNAWLREYFAVASSWLLGEM